MIVFCFPFNMIIALLVIQLLKDSMFRIDAENKLPYPDYGGPDFINTSLEYSIGELHKLVVENGGTFSMNLSKAVTHAIASQKKGRNVFFCVCMCLISC